MTEQCTWEGLAAPADETDDTEIMVWEIDPHLQSSDYDTCLERSWQGMLDYVNNNLDLWLEGKDVEELEAGVNLRFRLVRMRKSDYLEIVNDHE